MRRLLVFVSVVVAVDTLFFTALTPLGGNAFLGFLGVAPLLIAIRSGMGVVSAPLYPACARMCAAWVPAVHQAASRHSSSRAHLWAAPLRP